MRPSMQPSMRPSMQPSMRPSTIPSMMPSTLPSMAPSAKPSMQPSNSPSVFPSSSPTARCDDPANRLTDESIQAAVNLFREDKNEAESQYGPIEDWCTQNVTNMDRLFFVYSDFNEPIGDWDVSRVTSMFQMVSFIVVDLICFGLCSYYSTIKVCNPLVLTPFPQFYIASSFNQNISSWDVSSATSMEAMVSFIVVDLRSFRLCIQYTIIQVYSQFDLTPLPKFGGAISFNQDISSWDVSSVMDMNSMVSLIMEDWESFGFCNQFVIVHGLHSIQPDTFATVWWGSFFQSRYFELGR